MFSFFSMTLLIVKLLLSSLASTCATFQLPLSILCHFPSAFEYLLSVLIVPISATSLFTPYDFHPCNSFCLAVSKPPQFFHRGYFSGCNQVRYSEGNWFCLSRESRIFFFFCLWLVVICSSPLLLDLLHFLSLRWCRIRRFVSRHRRSPILDFISQV